jgi:hypothetical protein
MHHCPSAHGARLQCHVERGTRQSIVPGNTRRIAQRNNLCVPTRVLRSDHLVPSLTEQYAIAHYHSTYRHLTFVSSTVGERECTVHPLIVIYC